MPWYTTPQKPLELPTPRQEVEALQREINVRATNFEPPMERGRRTIANAALRSVMLPCDIGLNCDCNNR